MYIVIMSTFVVIRQFQKTSPRKLRITKTGVPATIFTIYLNMHIVSLFLQDINDHRPIFTRSEYQGAVLRIADLATIVVDDIVANDDDMPVSFDKINPNSLVRLRHHFSPPIFWEKRGVRVNLMPKLVLKNAIIHKAESSLT